MKHFAQFAPSYNNIGLGVGAAVGLARGSGLIGESQEERDNTTGLGRLGKLAGYTGGGAALGAGAGMAIKYVRGNTAETPTSQRRREQPEPLITRQDEPTKPEPITPNAVNSWATPSPTQNPQDIGNHVNPKKAAGYLGLSAQDRTAKIKQRKNLFLNHDGIPYSVGEGRIWTDEKMRMTRAIKPYKKPENTTAEDVVVNNIRREAKLNKIRDINKKIEDKISGLVSNSNYMKSYIQF